MSRNLARIKPTLLNVWSSLNNLTHFYKNILPILIPLTSLIFPKWRLQRCTLWLADEARDRCTEQLAVCVRFVTQKGVVRECFLGLWRLQSFDAKSIADEMEAMLQSHNLGVLLCVAQAYDGASVMSGAVGGVQARFRERHPEAVYVHCYAHKLNLVLCYSCKAIPEANAFLHIFQQLTCEPQQVHRNPERTWIKAIWTCTALHNKMGVPGEVCQCCLEQPFCHFSVSQQHEHIHGPRDPVKALQDKDPLHACDVFQTPRHNWRSIPVPAGGKFGLEQSSSVQDGSPSNFDRAPHRLWWWRCVQEGHDLMWGKWHPAPCWPQAKTKKIWWFCGGVSLWVNLQSDHLRWIQTTAFFIHAWTGW